MAAKAGHELAGGEGFEGLAPLRSLIVLLLDREPGPDEIRRIQAHENAREPLSLLDQQVVPGAALDRVAERRRARAPVAAMRSAANANGAAPLRMLGIACSCTG